MDQAHPTQVAGRRRAILVAILLSITVALGAYLRLRDLGAPGLWFDEGVTLEQATRPALMESIKASTTHPPLARLLVRASVATLGKAEPGGNDFAARLPSALMGTLGILLFFLCARRLADGDDVVGLVAAAIFAVGPFGVYYSQEARFYAGLALFAAWVYHGAMLVAERPRAAWRQAYLLLGLVLGLFNHHFGVVAYLASLLLVWPPLLSLLLRIRAQGQRSPWSPWALLPHAIAGAAYVPWLWFAFSNLEKQARPWIPNLAYQLPDVLAGWFTGRVGYYHVQQANWNQLLWINVAVSSGLLVGAGLLVHVVQRRRDKGLWTALAVLGPLAGAAFLHDLTVSTRFFHHKYLAFLYPLVALCVAELLVFTWRSVAGLTLWPALAAAVRGRGPRPNLWHRDKALAWGWLIGLGALVVAGLPAIRGALEAHERHRWGSPTYLPREHYQEVSRWIQARRSPGDVVMVYDPHIRQNNEMLLRYYGVDGSIACVSDWLARNSLDMKPHLMRQLAQASALFVVTAHASEEEHRMMLRLTRDHHRPILAEWDSDAAEGFTRAVHLGAPGKAHGKNN